MAKVQCLQDRPRGKLVLRRSMKCFPVLEPMITLASDRGQHSGNQAPFLPPPSSLPRSHPRTIGHNGHTRSQSSRPEHSLTPGATVLKTVYSIPCRSCVSVRSFSRAATLEERLSFGSVYTRLLKDCTKLEKAGGPRKQSQTHLLYQHSYQRLG